MARLSLYLLGPPRIERDGAPIKVDTRKGIALLAYLAITGESKRRDSLVNLLWPESDQTRGRASLRRTLSALKRALAGDWLEADRETVSLKASPYSSTGSGQAIWLDVDQFQTCLAECLAHGHPPSQVCPACLTPLTTAVELYRDDFLSGFSLKDSFDFDDWQFFQAEALRRELAGALERLAQGYSAQGEFESATSYASRWLALDRLNEVAHCQLMQLYAWSGQRSAALRQYTECARILESQLGLSPQESTTELYQAIKEGRAPGPPAGLPLQTSVEKREDQTPARPEALAIDDRAVRPIAEPPPAVSEEEKRIVTVLFADISRSFGGRRDLDPEDEATIMHRFLEVMKDALAKYGGQFERPLGRRVLAIFGTPQAHESDPELAIRAAIEIGREAGKLGLSPSAGITTGEVYLRRGDAEEPGEITLVGPVVNLAMYLAAQASEGQILIGESTYDLTRRAFEFGPLSMEIPDIDEPVAAYRVERLRLHPQKARGIEGLSAELVGRDEELSKLKAALAQVLAGRGQMASLIGEAGVGKSRLVAELKAHALHRGDEGPTPLWLEGRCLELGAAASYWPFIDILREYFMWGARDSNRRRRERIISALREMVERGDLSEERFEAMWPLLGLLLSVRLGDDMEERLKGNSPEQIRRRTFLAVHDFFVTLANRQPVVLVFEDLHWADSLSLDLISLLMEGLLLGPLFLLCVYRPDREHKCWHLGTIAAQKCRGRYTELRLRELTYQQSRRLVESLLVIEALPTSVKDLILDRSQGNPFFIEEVVRSLIEGGLVYRKGGFWRARGEIDSLVVPESVQSVILSRVDYLEEDWKYVLQIAAVIGLVFPRRVLEYAAQQQAALASSLWKLEDRALIYQERTIPEEEYSFKHVLTQETIYQNILKGRRRAIHRQVAEAIEALYSDSLDEYYEQLAYHYEQGSKVEQAIAYLLKAGEKAKRSSANEVAITHFTRGLALLKMLPDTSARAQTELTLQIALGLPLVLTRGHAAPEVEKTYARARVLSEHVYAGDISQHFYVLLGLRRYYFGRGEYQAAYEQGERLLALAHKGQDRSHLSRAHGMHGELLYWLGAFTQSREHCMQGAALYDRQQHRFHAFLYGNDTGVLCGASEALALWHLGYPDQALKRAGEMLTLAQELSHPFTLVLALNYTILLHQCRREVGAVQEWLEALLRISTEQDFALYSAWGTVVWGWSLAEQGELEEGITQMQRGLAAWRARGLGIMQPKHLSFLAKAYGNIGQVGQGLSALNEALRLADKNGERCWEAELYRLKGELLLQAEADGKAEAEACFLEAIEVSRQQKAKSWELRATMSLSRLWQKQDRQAEARQMLAKIYGWFTEGFDTVDLKEAKALLEALA